MPTQRGIRYYVLFVSQNTIGKRIQRQDAGYHWRPRALDSKC